MPHPLHEQVRQAFGFRCGYCRVDETGAGAELTVDHFRPSAVGGADDLENLVYACFRCNLYKGDYWPLPEEEAAGLYVLHPVVRQKSVCPAFSTTSSSCPTLVPAPIRRLRRFQSPLPNSAAAWLSARARPSRALNGFGSDDNIGSSFSKSGGDDFH